jgi:hypothetical protein
VALVAHYRMSSMKRGEEAIKGKRMSVDVANAMGTSDVELLRENVAETVPNCGGSRKIFLPEPAWRAASSEIFRRHPMPSSSTEPSRQQILLSRFERVGWFNPL